jgi:hypothetical protein
MATKVQYGIKHMMVLTVVVAIVAAAVGPFVRSWDAKRQLSFAIRIAGALLVLAGYIYWLCRYRMRAERRAGEVIFRIRTSHGPLARGILIGAIGSLVVLMLILTILEIQLWNDRRALIVDLVSSSVWLVVLIAPFVTWLWWGLDARSIEVCERGFILGGNTFLSYSKLKHYHWERYGAKKLILFRYWGWDVRLNIPTEMRDEVGRLLDENGVTHKERGFW